MFYYNIPYYIFPLENIGLRQKMKNTMQHNKEKYQIKVKKKKKKKKQDKVYF